MLCTSVYYQKTATIPGNYTSKDCHNSAQVYQQPFELRKYNSIQTIKYFYTICEENFARALVLQLLTMSTLLAIKFQHSYMIVN